MAILPISNQYVYTGRGPFDSKALVKTYQELLDIATWTVDGKFVAYNGMITAVWLNKADTSKNGVYVLFDPDVTTALKKPDVAESANWHKLADLSDITALTSQLDFIAAELTGVKTRLSALEADKVVIRRDNEYNYKQKTPANNEICLVDVPGFGLRVKIGDGSSVFTDLPYIDEPVLRSIDSVIIKGYFYQDQFYTDATHTELLAALTGRIYIDAVSSKLYTYNGINYEAQKTSLPNASAQVAGIVKLYDETGLNTDGTMTQRAITNELNGMNEEIGEKFEMLVDHDDEMLVFGRDLF